LVTKNRVVAGGAIANECIMLDEPAQKSCNRRRPLHSVRATKLLGFFFKDYRAMAASTTDRIASIYYPLRLTYGLVPLVAGLDKFFHLLTDWNKYLPAFAADLLPISTSNFMLIVGVIEIVAGLAVLTVFTRLGAYVVAAWLALIAVNLVLAGYYDIAVRDVVMAVGAFALGQAAAVRGEAWLPSATQLRDPASHAAIGSTAAPAK
jgi:hypothetical protein